jgi:acyl-CoA reductase-like NAD-dependent aldehyde dehydrogenase
MLEVRDPADVRSVVGQVPAMTAAEVEAAYDRARAGFETWRRTGPLDRAAVLARCAALIRARLDTQTSVRVEPVGVVLAICLLAEAGLPDGVLQVITGRNREISDALLASPDAVTFTGSNARSRALLGCFYTRIKTPAARYSW